MIKIPNPIPAEQHTRFGRGEVSATPVTWPGAPDGALVICDEPEPMPIGTRVYPPDPRRGTFRYALIFENIAGMDVVIESLQDLRAKMLGDNVPDEPVTPARPCGEHQALPEREREYDAEWVPEWAGYDAEWVPSDCAEGWYKLRDLHGKCLCLLYPKSPESLADDMAEAEAEHGVKNARRPVLP